MKLLIFIIKKIIFAFCIIYAFNIMGTGLNIFIPLNVITISVVSFLGMSGLLALIGVYFVLI